MVLGPAGSYHLRDGTVVGESLLTPYGPLAPRHLARLDGIEHVGDQRSAASTRARRWSPPSKS